MTKRKNNSKLLSAYIYNLVCGKLSHCSLRRYPLAQVLDAWQYPLPTRPALPSLASPSLTGSVHTIANITYLSKQEEVPLTASPLSNPYKIPTNDRRPPFLFFSFPPLSSDCHQIVMQPPLQGAQRMRSMRTPRRHVHLFTRQSVVHVEAIELDVLQMEGPVDKYPANKRRKPCLIFHH